MLLACIVIAIVTDTSEARGQSRAVASTDASLSGTVLTDATELPLMNAEITIAKLSLTARSDSAGNFAISGIPPGEYAVAIRLQGFEPLYTTLKFASSQKVEVDFLLKDRVIQYAPKSEDKRTGTDPDIGRVTFEERRQTGIGRYFGAEGEVIADNRPSAEVIRKTVPSLHANDIGRGQKALASKAPKINDSTFVRGDSNDIKAGAKLDCYVQVLLNGNVMYRATPNEKLFDVNSIPSRMLISVTYHEADRTPARYAGSGSQCGTLLIMTRGR